MFARAAWLTVRLDPALRSWYYLSVGLGRADFYDHTRRCSHYRVRFIRVEAGSRADHAQYVLLPLAATLAACTSSV